MKKVMKPYIKYGLVDNKNSALLKYISLDDGTYKYLKTDEHVQVISEYGYGLDNNFKLNKYYKISSLTSKKTLELPNILKNKSVYIGSKKVLNGDYTTSVFKDNQFIKCSNVKDLNKKPFFLKWEQNSKFSVNNLQAFEDFNKGINIKNHSLDIQKIISDPKKIKLTINNYKKFVKQIPSKKDSLHSFKTENIYKQYSNENDSVFWYDSKIKTFFNGIGKSINSDLYIDTSGNFYSIKNNSIIKNKYIYYNKSLSLLTYKEHAIIEPLPYVGHEKIWSGVLPNSLFTSISSRIEAISQNASLSYDEGIVPLGFLNQKGYVYDIMNGPIKILLWYSSCSYIDNSFLDLVPIY